MEKIDTKTCDIQSESKNLSQLVNEISSDNKINWSDRQKLDKIIEMYQKERAQCLQETKDNLKDLLKKSLENWFLIKNENDFNVLKQMLQIIWNNSNLWNFDRNQTNHVIWLKNNELFLWKNWFIFDFSWTYYLKKFNNWTWENVPLDVEFQLNKNSFKKENIKIPISNPITPTPISSIVPVEKSLVEWEELMPKIPTNTKTPKNKPKYKKNNIPKKEVPQTNNTPIIEKKPIENESILPIVEGILPIKEKLPIVEEKININISSWVTIEDKEQYDKLSKSFKLPLWEKLPDEIKNKTASQILTLAQDSESKIVNIYFWEKRVNESWQEYLMRYGKIIDWEFKKASFLERNFTWDNLDNNKKI